ncbi:MAG: hypothetical protein V7L26_02720 [Nostoc sp.]|uniref:hypothetical protein n=1 Tax=Nostoc sp. TaxID=1180 RepID=UPI002FF2AAFC
MMKTTTPIGMLVRENFDLTKRGYIPIPEKEVLSVWFRRPKEIEISHVNDKIAAFIKAQSTALLRGLYFGTHDSSRWVNPLPNMHRSRDKFQQIQLARKLDMRIPLNTRRVDMLQKLKYFILLCCLSAVFFVTFFSVNAQDRLTDKSQVFINGIGPVRVGMTVEQASKASGTRLISNNYTNDGSNSNCFYIQPESNPKNITFMVTNGRISRVDILGNKKITTVKGARIGDTKARVISLYKGNIQETNSESSSSIRLLRFTPTDRNDKNYRLIFEIYENRVNSFRSGKLPEVEYSEGCA